MHLKTLLLSSLLMASSGLHAEDRALWGSVMGNKDATYNHSADGKLLLSWRMLPDDDADTAFDLYVRLGVSKFETKLNTSPIKATCFQRKSFGATADHHYRLTYAGQTETIGEFTMKKDQLSGKLPYIQIDLAGTDDFCSLPEIKYCANDMSVGDLDGDGQMEVVVKRIQSRYDVETQTVTSDGTGASTSYQAAPHIVIWDAYKLDGTLLWRVKSGPSQLLGNSSCFAVADFDGDGRAEMAIKTGEGTIFGDGTEIGDTNGDGITDYRTWTGGWVDHYNSAGPEFISVVDGATGRELARADYISRDKSEDWGDNYWKRANSHRLGAGSFSGEFPSIFVGRGVYGRSVLEAWDYRDGQLTRRFHFDSSASGTNKDGKPNSAYAGQGNHSFNIADLDGDGKDEVMYGSMVIDDDGVGLWSSGLGHGDANHVGKFVPGRDGLQVFHCLEGGVTNVALHDGATGEIIYDNKSSQASDCGRCLVADIDPANPGCEIWWAGSNAYSVEGKDLGYKPASCNMAIWFDGTLSQQLINEGIIQSQANGRIFTMYRYDESFNNSSKSNPGWYGDMLGDWREEVILPDRTKLNNIKIFSTWFPTEHRLPWLMTDHTYLMSAINQNVGYNQPNHTGYYIGSDVKDDSEFWAAAKAMRASDPSSVVTAIKGIAVETSLDKKQSASDDHWYSLTGQRVDCPTKGIFIKNGRKYRF